jgi:hypothetical protein
MSLYRPQFGDTYIHTYMHTYTPFGGHICHGPISISLKAPRSRVNRIARIGIATSTLIGIVVVLTEVGDVSLRNNTCMQRVLFMYQFENVGASQ